MNRCVMCGHEGLRRTTAVLDFNEVARVEGIVYTCPGCGERYEGFSRVEELEREVARHIARRPERLGPAEIRFLRKRVGYSGKDFAAFLGVTPETVSRWESRTDPKPMKLATEKLLRWMALSERPFSEYGLVDAGTRERASRPPLFRDHDGWRAA